MDYLPLQHPSIGERFPEIPREQFETAVQLIEPDGTVFSAAEAVFRSLAHHRRNRWQLWCYENILGVRPLTEITYHFVARHREFFSAVTRLLWGRHAERPTYHLTQWIFLRWLGIIFLFAFGSLWAQLDGLIGQHGITPAAPLMENLHNTVNAQGLGFSRYFLFPSLCWFAASDAALHFQCVAGVVLSIFLIIGIAPALSLFFLWLLYLSLSLVSEPFLSFQWDTLLLETAFIGIFFAPWKLLPGFRGKASPPSTLGLFLFRWLLFRLMFGSGCMKLLTHDPTWRNLTALTFHYETQPLPTWIGWYAFQLPASFHKASVVMMFVVLLAFPFFISLPRRMRFVAAFAFMFLESLIFLTGNYCFFNLLTIGLCLLLFDDFALLKLFPTKMRERIAKTFDLWVTKPVECKRPEEPEPIPPVRPPGPLSSKMRHFAVMPIAILFVLFGAMNLPQSGHLEALWPGTLQSFNARLSAFRSINHYGLFSVMTTNRPEIIIEGSNDGTNWLAYEFKYKPGDLQRRPQFVEPHQPRLDWQMWFAALGDLRQNPWFVSFCYRLLQGQPEVVALMQNNPFPSNPPKLIRATVYDYHFTNLEERRATGNWWRKEEKSVYFPPVSLEDFRTK